MKRFIEFNVHYYMDMYPFKEVRIMDTENINEYLEQAKQWSSGVVSLSKVFSIEDARKYVNQKIDEEKTNWQEDSEEIIGKMMAAFKEAYNEEF